MRRRVGWMVERPHQPRNALAFLWQVVLGLLTVAFIAYGLWYGINSP